jgi:hypothetical protein
LPGDVIGMAAGAHYINNKVASVRTAPEMNVGPPTTIRWGCTFAVWAAVGSSSAGIAGCVDGGAPAVPGPAESGSTSAASSGESSGNPFGSSGASGASTGFAFGESTGFGFPSGGSGAFGSTSGGESDEGLDAAAQPDAGALPCAMERLAVTKCQPCHGTVRVVPAPMSLVTVADFKAPSIEDPTMNYAEEAIFRMRNTYAPMPQPPYPPATSADVATIQNWIKAGYPATGCSTSAQMFEDEAGVFDASGGSDYDGPIVCSSGQMSNAGPGPSMYPGEACDGCHSFYIAGTAYKTEHESDNCNGANVSGANIVITDSTGAVTTIPINSVGNFYSTKVVSAPFQAKITYQGRERDMLEMQAYGNCNLCHSDVGYYGAPGRLMLP